MKLGPLLATLRGLEAELAADYRDLAERHAAEHDVFHQCQSFALQCERHAHALDPHLARYGEDAEDGWGRLVEAQSGSSSMPALLRDLEALLLAAEETSITWVMAGQAALAARDAELLDTVSECHTDTELQVKWLTTRIKVAAPQALVGT